jgi:hypothetical protein
MGSFRWGARASGLLISTIIFTAHKNPLLATYVTLPVATRAESNQVLRRISAKLAPSFYVVNV